MCSSIVFDWPTGYIIYKQMHMYSGIVWYIPLGNIPFNTPNDHDWSLYFPNWPTKTTFQIYLNCNIKCYSGFFEKFFHNSLIIYGIIMKLPRMKFPTFSLLFPDLMAHIPCQFYTKLCEIFLLTENISKYWIREDMFFLTIWFCLWSNIPLFCFWIEIYFPHIRKHEIPYIFQTFWPISHPFLTLSANSLPFQCRTKFKSDSWLFQDFPYPWEPWRQEWSSPDFNG